MRLGKLIASTRKHQGLTIRELEFLSGISNPMICQIETGRIKEPGFFKVVKLCDALGISIQRAAQATRSR